MSKTPESACWLIGIWVLRLLSWKVKSFVKPLLYSFLVSFNEKVQHSIDITTFSRYWITCQPFSYPCQFCHEHCEEEPVFFFCPGQRSSHLRSRWRCQFVRTSQEKERGGYLRTPSKKTYFCLLMHELHKPEHFPLNPSLCFQCRVLWEKLKLFLLAPVCSIFSSSSLSTQLPWTNEAKQPPFGCLD